MAYCWEVYQKSECEECSFFKSFKSGNYDFNKIKDIIVVTPEEMEKIQKSSSHTGA